MNPSPLALLQLFVRARRIAFDLTWADMAAQSGASIEALRRADRRWWVATSDDLFALLKWTGLRGTPVGAALVNQLNERMKK